MKKLNLAIALALGLAIPFALQADDEEEVTIRVMQMNEYSTQDVMRRIQLPEAASDRVTDEATLRKRLTNRSGDGEAPGEGYPGQEVPGKNYEVEGPHGAGYAGAEEGVGEMDRDRLQDQSHFMEQDQDWIRDQDQEHIQQQDQDQIRDPSHELDLEPGSEQDQDIEGSGSGQSEENQQGPGPQG